MTPQEHFEEAERLLASVTPSAIAKEGVLGDVAQHVAQRLAEAQVHSDGGTEWGIPAETDRFVTAVLEAAVAWRQIDWTDEGLDEYEAKLAAAVDALLAARPDQPRDSAEPRSGDNQILLVESPDGNLTYDPKSGSVRIPNHW